MITPLQTVADHLAANQTLRQIPGIEIIPEDETDAAAAVDRALASTGVIVLVGVASFARRSNSGACLTGTITISVDVLENAALNRIDENPGYRSAPEIAILIAQILHGETLSGFTSALHLVNLNRADIPPSTAVMRSTYTAEINIYNALNTL